MSDLELQEFQATEGWKPNPHITVVLRGKEETSNRRVSIFITEHFSDHDPRSISDGLRKLANQVEAEGLKK